MTRPSRVLIVEDQADIRSLIRVTLEFGDFELHEADNGRDGLHLAMNLRPDIVLLDVMMPGELDGSQVCRKIKAERSLALTRVVLLTARGQQSDLEEGKRAGADRYLVKPFSPLELIDEIDALIAAPPAVVS